MIRLLALAKETSQPLVAPCSNDDRLEINNMNSMEFFRFVIERFAP
ncbi:hypothetical protein ACKFKG_18625 [Phormidesmis sp. 146-35]